MAASYLDIIDAITSHGPMVELGKLKDHDVCGDFIERNIPPERKTPVASLGIGTTITLKLCPEDSAKLDRILGMLEKMDLDRTIARGLFTEPTAEMKADATPSTKELISDLFRKSTNYRLPPKAADPEEIAKAQLVDLGEYITKEPYAQTHDFGANQAQRSKRGYEFL